MFRKLMLATLIIVSLNNTVLLAVDKILAQVNKDIITQSEADAYLNIIIMQLSQQYSGKELQDKIQDERKDLLMRMIEDKIILQEGKRKGIQAKISKVRDKIEEMKESSGSEASFDDFLSEKGLTVRDLEKMLSEQIIMREIIQSEVKDKINISPEDVTKFYETNKEEFSQAETRIVESISIEDEAIIPGLLDELNRGADFSLTADKYGVTYYKEPITKTQVRPEISDRVFSLKIGEISKAIKTANTFYIFKLVEIQEPKTLDLTSVNEKISELLYQETFAERMQEWLNKLKSKAYIEIKK